MVPGHRRQICGRQRAQLGRWLRWFVIADHAAHLVQAGFHEVSALKRRVAGEQFVKQYAEGVNIAARVQIYAGQPCLLRTHISRCADKLPHRRVNRLVRQPLLGCLGNSEIDHLGHWLSVLHGYKDI